MTEILFVRHGETSSNTQGLLHGRTDVPLTAVGEQQARRVAARLSLLGEVHALYSSPLIRARTTAEVISTRLGLLPRLDPLLQELDFGDLEGSTVDALVRDHPELYARILDLADIDMRFPNGESRREFHARVRSVLDDLLTRHEGERLIVVAHGGVIGSGIAQLTGGDPNDWVRFMVRNCSITHVEVAAWSAATLHCWDDVVHLEEDWSP